MKQAAIVVLLTLLSIAIHGESSRARQSDRVEAVGVVIVDELMR